MDIDVGDVLSVSGEYPGWLTLVDNGNGSADLSGTPTNDNVGGHSVVLTVSDGTETVNQEFLITVENTNDAPVFTSTPVDSVLEDTEYSYQITSVDIDVGDVISIAGEFPLVHLHLSQ